MDGEIELLGERIAEQAAHLDAATHRLLTDLREFDARGGWYTQGTLSCAHWLSWRVGWDLVTARERVRVARKLASFPVIDDALRRGEVSYSKVRAMVRVATPANEVMILEYARLTTASQFEKLSRKYALVQRHGEESRPRDDEQRRYVRRRDTDDGMVKIEAVLHPEEAELVWTMLDHAAKHLPHEPQSRPTSDVSAESRGMTHVLAAATTATPRDSVRAGNDSAEACEITDFPSTVATATVGHTTGSSDASAEACEMTNAWVGFASGVEPTMTTGLGVPSAFEPTLARMREPSILHQRVDATKRAFNRADALVSITQSYLRGDQPNRAPVEIMITIPASNLQAGIADPVDVGCMSDSCLSAEAARRLSCDAGVIEVVEDEHGVPLSIGRKRRTIAGSIKRALLKRDTACTFPGCTHRIFLEGHHIQHWADGGETSLENIALLCSHHHRYVHEYGYSIELGVDQRPQFRDPCGRLVAAVPGRDTPPDLGWPWIRAANASLAIDADTIACEWDGTPVDLRQGDRSPRRCRWSQMSWSVES